MKGQRLRTALGFEFVRFIGNEEIKHTRTLATDVHCQRKEPSTRRNRLPQRTATLRTLTLGFLEIHKRQCRALVIEQFLATRRTA